jgi:hypothetical protein
MPRSNQAEAVAGTQDPVWDAFSSLPIEDRRTPEQKARWEAAIEEIRTGQYERPTS